MHKLSASFILAYHGCDRSVGEALLDGEKFQKSNNNYDWLGPGAYFWEANPQRGLDFAKEVKRRLGENSHIQDPFVVGAIIDLGFCLDLLSQDGIGQVKAAYKSLVEMTEAAGNRLPENDTSLLKRKLDCAVMRHLHVIRGREPELKEVDTVKGVFVEGEELYPGSGFHQKSHIQICVRNLECVKGVFRVPGIK